MKWFTMREGDDSWESTVEIVDLCMKAIIGLTIVRWAVCL